MEKGRNRFTVTAEAYGLTNPGTSRSLASRPPYKDTNSAIACEDLAGIGERTTARKPERSRMKGWAFYQLRQLISYKATTAGIPIIPVDPRDTSRTCPECGHCEKLNRKTRDKFECRSCGHADAADRVGARSIRHRAIRDWATSGRLL